MNTDCILSSVFCTYFGSDPLHSTWESDHRAILHPLARLQWSRSRSGDEVRLVPWNPQLPGHPILTVSLSQSWLWMTLGHRLQYLQSCPKKEAPLRSTRGHSPYPSCQDPILSQFDNLWYTQQAAEREELSLMISTSLSMSNTCSSTAQVSHQIPWRKRIWVNHIL